MKRRVKADRLTPAYPFKGALIRRLTDGVAPGFGLPIDSSFALAGEAVPLRVTETSLRRPPGFEALQNGNLRLSF
jgi:hypothetical protein